MTAVRIPGYVFTRRLDRILPRAVKAHGVWIEDETGHRILDACGGAIVVNVGHGRLEIADAVYEQMRKFSYVHGTVFTSEPVEALAEKLARHAPDELNRFYFMCSGSEAVETAVKMARQIQLERGRPGRMRLISRWKSYHGLTLGALAASGRTYFREPFTPLLPEVVHIHPPYCLRCSYGLTYPSCELRCALALEDTILNMGPDTVFACLIEPVSGAALGVCPPPPGYLRLIRDICDRYEIVLIFDEVMVGMGRTGRWFACEHEGVTPDLMTLGKGLTSGALPLSAVGVRSEYMDLIGSGSGSFVHGGTFSHHAVAAAAGLAVVDIIEREDLVSRADHMGSYLGKCLKDRLGGLEHVLEVRGLGMLWGVELGQDKVSGKPFPRSEKVAERIREAMLQRGVLVYPCTGLAGKDGDAVILGPPYVIERNEIDRAVETLAAVIQSILPS